MKRFMLTIAISLCLTLFIAGCTSAPAEQDTPETQEQTTPSAAPAPEASAVEPVVSDHMYLIGSGGGIYRINGDSALYIFPDADMFGDDGENLYVLRDGVLYQAFPDERIIAKGLEHMQGYNNSNFFVSGDLAFFAMPFGSDYTIVTVSLDDGGIDDLPLTVVSPGSFSVEGDIIYSAQPSEEGVISLDAYEMSTGISTTYTFNDVAAASGDSAIFWEGSVFYYFNGAAGEALTGDLQSGQAVWLPFGDVDYNGLIGLHDGSLYQMNDNSVFSFDLSTGAYAQYYGFDTNAPTDIVFGVDGFGVSDITAEGSAALYICQYGLSSAKRVALPFGGAVWTGTVNEDSELPSGFSDFDDDEEDIISEVPSMVG